MIKITQKHKDCIGCGVCVALCSKFWEMGNDNKANLKGSTKKENGDLELELKEVKKDDCNKIAEESCPVQIIKIEN